MWTERTVLFTLLALLTNPTCTCAKISNREVERDGRQLVQIEMPFAFASRGVIRLELQGVNVENIEREAAMSALGFFIIPSENDLEVLHEDYMMHKCYLSDEGSLGHLFNFGDWEVEEKIEQEETFSVEYPVEGRAGEYSLYFANCDGPTLVSFQLRVEMYNLHGGEEDLRKDYLSVAEDTLPALYHWMALVFAGLGAVWYYLCSKEKATVQMVHHLMSLLILLQTLTLLMQARMYHFLQATGTSQGWKYGYYVSLFPRGIVFFTTVLLLGTGWSYPRPLIGDKKRHKFPKALLLIIPLQIFVNSALVYVEETSPVNAEFFVWKCMLHTSDLVCYCTALFPLVHFLWHLEEKSADSEKFWRFLLLFTAYLHSTRFLMYIAEYMVPYNMGWISSLGTELVTLLFFGLAGMRFKPLIENGYVQLIPPQDVCRGER